MFDELFAEDNRKAARDLISRPPPVPKQAAGFSAWRTTTAAPKGVVAGGSQVGAFGADVLGALGGMTVASGLGDPLLADRGAQVKEAERIQREGLDFSSGAGDNLRGFARFLAPDPETAHASERLVFDFARVATKAVGYSVAAGGPVGGALLTGADEGMTTADDLKQQGVDLGTRAAVGAVVGGVTALGVGLPMAGTTLAQTAGLVAVGGPLSFVAQQQAVRSILQSQDYSKLAEQYDPFDPVGLAVSTLIPAGFGAWGLRAAKARAATDASAAAAREAESFRAGPVPSDETPIARAAREATQEQVDAARVMLDMEQRRSTNPLGDDMRTADAHEAALSRAVDQLSRGERVAVDDLAPKVMAEQRDANFRAWFGESKVVDEAGAPLVVYHGTAQDIAAFDPSRLQAEGIHLSADPAVANTYAASRAMDGGRGANVVPVFVKANRVRDVPMITTDVIRQAAAEGFDAVRRGDHIVVMRPEQIKSAIGNSGRFDPNSASLTDSPFADWTASVNAAIRDMRQAAEAMQPKEPPRAAEPTAPRSQAAEPAPAAPATPARAAPAAEPAAARPAAPAAKAGLVDDAAALRVEQVRAQAPDLMVQLDGMDAPMRVDDLLAAVKAEADDLVLDGELLQVAATCALSVGA